MSEPSYKFSLTVTERDDLERSVTYFLTDIRRLQLAEKDPEVHLLLEKRLSNLLAAVQPSASESFTVPFDQRGMIPYEYRATAEFSPRRSSCCGAYLYRQRGGRPWRCLGCRKVQGSIVSKALPAQ